MKYRFNLPQLVILSFCFSLLMIVSCTKENSGNGTSTSDQEEAVASQTSSESDGQAEIIFNGVFDDAIGVSDEVGLAGTGVFMRPNSCPTVTVTHLNAPNTFPIRVVIDFGNTGCLGNDGRVRRGKVITEYTNRLLYPGAVGTTTFDGFYVDSIHVEGTHRITNTSTLTTQPPNRQFTADVIDGKLSLPNGNYVQWNSHKIITQTEGLTTAAPIDDVFKVEGSAHGTALRGNLLVAWEATIIEPLVKRYSCHWIVKGRVRTVRINNTVNSPWVAVLDFGTGTCDNQATVTINGVTHQITLP